MNREKVIKGLECCLGANDCDIEPEEDCPYKGMCLCAMALRLDVLALLKEQQPKTGHWEVLTMCANEGTYCSVCHTKIFDFVHPPKKKLSQYCPHCGAKMTI